MANPVSQSSNYPNNYETEVGANGIWPENEFSDPYNPDFANRVRNSIISIQESIGKNPQSVFPTLADRLNSIESGTGLTVLGDISGNLSSITVDKIKGRPISSGVPQDNQILKYDLNTDTWIFDFEAAIVSTDHGNLDGLTDDDHPQYLLVDGSRQLTGNIDIGNNKIQGISIGLENSPSILFTGTNSGFFSSSNNIGISISGIKQFILKPDELSLGNNTTSEFKIKTELTNSSIVGLKSHEFNIDFHSSGSNPVNIKYLRNTNTTSTNVKSIWYLGNGTSNYVMNLDHYQATLDLNGVLRVSNGSVSSPSQSFILDTDSGFYSNSLNEVSLSLGGSNKVRFYGTGIDMTGRLLLQTSDSYITLTQRTSTPSSPAVQSQSNIYMKAGKLVVQYRLVSFPVEVFYYKWINLNDGSTNWNSSSTAP